MPAVMGPSSNKPRILLVDAATTTITGLVITLETEGYEVIHAEDGIAGLELAHRLPADLVLTDVTLPAMDGLRMIQKLREADLAVPLIVVTANADESTRIAALRVGADDYMLKPFGLLELLERIKIQLRRPRPAQPAGDRAIRIGETVIDLHTRMVRRGPEESRLRPKEFELLSSLWQARGDVVAKEQLLSDLWGFNCPIDTRRVDFQVTALREKIEVDPAHPLHLLTVRGVGYRLLA